VVYRANRAAGIYRPETETTSLMRYGLISANRGNIGDDMQTLAAEQFLPRVDIELDQDSLDQTTLADPVKVICNGWWARSKAAWPPPANVLPLMVGAHITANLKGRFITPAARALYTQPFGARDTYTLDFLTAANIPAYLSRCLTLTFQRHPGPRSGITCVDVSPEAIPHLKHRVTQFVGHYQPDTFCRMSAAKRRALAGELLNIYGRSELVITTRLHCALPCLALGTPVVLVLSGYSPERFLGYEKLLYFSSPAQLPLLDPAAISCANIDIIRDNLRVVCSRFVQN
jgi:hypothetical protein